MLVNHGFEAPELVEGQFRTTSLPGWELGTESGSFRPSAAVASPTELTHVGFVGANQTAGGFLAFSFGPVFRTGKHVFSIDVIRAAAGVPYPGHKVSLSTVSSGQPSLVDTQLVIDLAVGESRTVSMLASIDQGAVDGSVQLLVALEQGGVTVAGSGPLALFDNLRLEIFNDACLVPTASPTSPPTEP